MGILKHNYVSFMLSASASSMQGDTVTTYVGYLTCTGI